MAIWQFRFWLVPEVEVRSIFGRIPASLAEYQGNETGPQLIANDFANYWGESSPKRYAEAVGAVLAPKESWSADAVMFGCGDGGDCVELWPDEFIAELDLRKLNGSLISALLTLAVSSDLLIAVDGSGKLILPNAEDFVAEIDRSRANRFMRGVPLPDLLK